jgi:histidinol-phosphate aminotransferase
MNLHNLLRKNIADLKPYSSARSEFKGEASVFLDANENPFNAPFNRYPDPLQSKLKASISAVKGVPTENIFLGNGSDEPIDLLYRAFCEPRINNVVAIDPTYGMYKVCADINDVEYRKVLLQEDFDFTANAILKATDKNSKIIWLCSPNNPTGNSLNGREIEKTLKHFHGIVVLDEAYIDFSSQPGFLKKLDQYPNLVILQTLSKAWGSAAIRLGMAFASPEIIQVLSNIKYPYNINILTQEQALRAIENKKQVEEWVRILLSERELLIESLKQLPLIKHIYPTDANFVLVKVEDADAVYRYLVKNSIVVRNRSTISLCAGCIRITVGTHEENAALIASLCGGVS